MSTWNKVKCSIYYFQNGILLFSPCLHMKLMHYDSSPKKVQLEIVDFKLSDRSVLFSSVVRPSFFTICFALNTHTQRKFIIMVCMWVIGPVSFNKFFSDCSGFRGNIKLHHAVSVVVPSSWCFSCLYFCSVPKLFKAWQARNKHGLMWLLWLR